VTVVDEHQGRGVGTILMGMLTLSARQMGILDTPTGRVFKAVARRVIPLFARRSSWLP
jgi:GNAT superfamily N-acetyltransferase